MANSKSFVIVCCIYLAIFITHFMDGNLTSSDSIWSIHTAISIVRESDTDLDEYDHLIRYSPSYTIEQHDEHSYTIFPFGASLIAVPFVILVREISNRLLGYDLYETAQQAVPLSGLETFVASNIIAATAVFIYLIARLRLKGSLALLVVFVFAFCTSAWSTGSRALWQHGPSMLMLSISLYLILLSYKHPPIIQFVAIPLTFSYLIRPTNSLSILLITIWVFTRHRRFLFPYLFWSASIALPFALCNLSIYQNILSPYYLPQRLGSTPYFCNSSGGGMDKQSENRVS